MADNTLIREAIDKEIARVKAAIQKLISDTRERAGVVEEGGIAIGEQGNKMYSDPLGFEAPKFHPVWADELRYELAKLRQMGEAGTVKKREYETDYVKWPRATVLERFQEAVSQVPRRALTPQEILRDAIQMGYEEGYPLRPEQIASIQRSLGLEPTGRAQERESSYGR